MSSVSSDSDFERGECINNSDSESEQCNSRVTEGEFSNIILITSFCSTISF